MPSNKTNNKKSSAKRSVQTNKVQKRTASKPHNSKSAQKVRGGDPTLLIHQLMPYILGLAAAFILVSYFIADSTGFLGGFLRNAMFGLFSGAAWAVPFLLVNIAFFWKRDIASGSVGYKLAFSFICISLLSALIHAFSRNAGVEGTDTFNIIELFKLGCDAKGGGMIGGLLGNVSGLHSVLPVL